jgi:hypothetical protein
VRNRSGQVATAEVLESNPKSPTETSIRPECVPGPTRHCVSATEAKDAAVKTLLRRALGPRELTEPEQASLVELRAKINMYNKAVPRLRLQLPSYSFSYRPYLSLNLEICADYYFKCAHLRFHDDAANKIVNFLTSFLEQYPLEWKVCSWKNDFIAELMLGEFNGSLNEQRENAERWLKWYWKRDQQKNRETDIYLSPKRMAASSAVLELEMLGIMDHHPQLWIVPGFAGYATFVNWLNRHWAALAYNKSGPALLKEVVSKFRPRRQAVAFSDSDLAEICDAYESIESSHPAGAVPPYQVVLTLVAKRHKVSPRLVSEMRAEQNKRRRSHITSKKARS